MSAFVVQLNTKWKADFMMPDPVIVHDAAKRLALKLQLMLLSKKESLSGCVVRKN
ncbi:hypothetical protein VIBNISFn27_790060 [Vibrio nigripulchritudo SFn27]|nr:hypothetical protein VIBNIBLFn1_820060 [Vibrio nigripulchritudo BLFn1]CCN90907.1 hypothetical protein VIBNISFn27_790060 [Vibrio nigripulchritudo SFn27]